MSENSNETLSSVMLSHSLLGNCNAWKRDDHGNRTMQKDMAERCNRWAKAVAAQIVERPSDNSLSVADLPSQVTNSLATYGIIEAATDGNPRLTRKGVSYFNSLRPYLAVERPPCDFSPEVVAEFVARLKAKYCPD